MGTEPGVRKGKRSLLVCHTHCKCSIETTRNSVVKLGIKVIKLVKGLIGMAVIVVGMESECYSKFVRGRLHIAEYDTTIKLHE